MILIYCGCNSQMLLMSDVRQSGLGLAHLDLSSDLAIDMLVMDKTSDAMFSVD